MMQLNFWDVLSNLISLFLLIAVGYMAVQFHMIPSLASTYLSRLLLKITLPCTIFTALLRPYDPAFLTVIEIVLVLVLAILLLSIAFARFLSRICRVKTTRRGLWAFCVTFSNFGFMGFPIALALFGEEGLALAAIFSLSSNLLLYSVGIRIMCADSAAENHKQPSWGSVILTGINFATFLGLIVYLCQLSLPTVILTPVTYLANVTTPLSMLITGMNLYGGNVRELFTDIDVFTASAARLIIIPLFSLLMMRIVHVIVPLPNVLITPVIFLLMSMPSPAITTILAENYHLDREFSARVVFLSSLFCILTIPLMTLLI